MLSTNVLCLKKRKKRSYCLSSCSDTKGVPSAKEARSSGGAVTMLQITEDTPPDALAGAMDLAVHLPTGRSVKMAVERSTPMMDLLVQITTNHHLQLSNYTLQALGMAPSSEHSDKILPYKPNTPIGTLDTQHIKVIPKSRALPVPKNIPPGHQPFESTFRLKVHLPRNQLYVTRVSRNVLLEDIMKKVCEEKNLDPMKYEFKHPGNLDQVLDPKLTLSDYQITEIYVVLKGAVSLNQAFSTSDIMALRKEEERKQMHTKTGGGVFNLIFRRGKSSMGSGSISSDTRSISPTHSDDSRSVTPPAVPQPIITPPKKDPASERPKPPQRKRRPAPKPPQQGDSSRKNSVEKPPSNISENANEVNELQSRKAENGLTICHSRNSSDSSGYHEASVLSENCNTSLPRRPKSAFVAGGDAEKMSKQHSQSTTNLSKMSSHSKSTTSLVTGRKKKAAPPPPPVLRSSNSSINVEKPSPVVASQPAITQKDTHYTTQENVVTTPSINPVPLPRSKAKAPPVVPRSRSEVAASPSTPQAPGVCRELQDVDGTSFKANRRTSVSDIIDKTKIDNECVVNEIIEEELGEIIKTEDKLDGITDQESEKSKVQSSATEKMLNRRTEHNTEPEQEKIIATKTESNIKKLDEFLKATKEKETNLRSKFTKSMPNISQLQKATHENIFTSSEFLGDKKPPEIVAMIPKAPRDVKGSPSKYGTFGRKRFQMAVSLTENFDEETISLHSRKSSDSKASDSKPGSISRNSVNSALDCFSFVDEFSDLDENVFTGSKRQSSKPAEDIFNQLFGIHNFENIKIDKNQSISSLRSITSLPGFLGSGTGMKKWGNSEDLDDISQASFETRNKWVVVSDASDQESILSSNISTTVDSLASISSCQNSSLTAESIKASDKSFGSTDSGIAQENHIEKQSEPELNISITPPPPPVYEETGSDNQPPTVLDSTQKTGNSEPSTEAIKEVQEEISTPPAVENLKKVTEPTKKTLEVPVNEEIVKEPIIELIKEPIGSPELNIDIKDSEIGDIDWQYQLPSPPKAFRDSSPVNFVNESCESESVTDFKDSVVTSPELFEKLKTIEDCQSDKGTTTSDATSVVSEEEKPLLNKLSLENLEKRKSLVYNRELATSLKMTDTVDNKSVKADTFSSSLTQFESTYEEIRKSSLPKETANEPKYQKPNISSNTLPNFKISTYDQPKQKIKVFEDDTIRSNTDNYLKINKIVETTAVSATSTTFVGRSMESISMRKNSLDNQLSHSDEDKGYKFYKPKAAPRSFGPMSCVFRSESFSMENTWSPSRPVSRSKSHLTLNAHKYREEIVDTQNEESISRSNSLFDVSGLQSLEVMKLIQNKLNTPTSSTENLNQKVFIKPEPKPRVVAKPASEESQKPTPEKIYKYQGPPSINMGTWSDRPKVPVSVKEDADYKLSHNVSSKLIVNTINNNITSNNSIEVKNNTSSTKINSTPSYNGTVMVNGYDKKDSNNVSIKINGTDPIISTQNSGNVVIKIGSLSPQPHNPKPIDSQRFINHTTASTYRKPFSNINRNQPIQRPHSVAFDSDFDISRVPVVRSVEFKKPFKDMSNNNNTSVTQIYQGNNNYKSHTLNRTEPVSELKNKFSSMYKSSETLPASTNVIHQKQEHERDAKPIFRANSYKPTVAPVVRGFKTTQDSANLNNRLSWNPPANYNTLPSKPKEADSYVTNKQVLFSQACLRRTDSNKLVEKSTFNNGNTPQDPVEINNEKNNTYNSLPTVNKSDIIKPPPPPLMPKVNFKKPVSKPVEPNLDPRDQLLSAIRNFGGKKGLKAVKA